MPVRHYLNTVKEGALSTPGVGTGNIVLNLDGAGLVNLPTIPFTIRIDADTATEELCLVTAGSPTALTVTRGYDGTSAFSHAAGAKIRHVATAEFFEKADAHVEATANVHGLSGGAIVVGDTSAQTITNKTIQSSIIDVAHSTSPASSFAFRVGADNTSSRDGYTWNKTAAATGKAIRIISSGTDRMTVDADGRVVLNSATAADHVLAVQESATERSFFQADGYLELGLQALGKTTARLLIRSQQATQLAVEGKDNGGTTRWSISALGAYTGQGLISTTAGLTVGGTSSLVDVNASGNAAITGTLAVTGASTLTGDVTLPLPGAGTTTRLTVNARTGGSILRGNNQAGTETSRLKETGELTLSEKAFVFNATSPVVAQVAATANVPSPVASMLVFNSTDKLWYQWSGSAWVVQGSLNNGSQGNVEYVRTTTQSIPNATMTKLNFTTSVQTDTNIVTVGASTDFTLVRAGVYYIKANVPWASSDGSGSRWAVIGKGSDDTVRYATTNSTGTDGGAKHIEVSTMRRFAASDVVSIYAFQDKTTGALNLAPSTATGPMTIELRWMGP